MSLRPFPTFAIGIVDLLVRRHLSQFEENWCIVTPRAEALRNDDNVGGSGDSEGATSPPTGLEDGPGGRERSGPAESGSKYQGGADAPQPLAPASRPARGPNQSWG
jgi:hypothetical protein